MSTILTILASAAGWFWSNVIWTGLKNGLDGLPQVITFGLIATGIYFLGDFIHEPSAIKCVAPVKELWDPFKNWIW